MLLSEGQMSDYKGAALMIDALPRAKVMLADKGYDGDFLREELLSHGIRPVIPSKAYRKKPRLATSGHARIKAASSGCSTA